MKTEARFNTETQRRMAIGKARTFIRGHAGDGITLAAIAQAAGTSPFHFSRLFSALARESVFDFVTRVRLQQAAAKLAAEPRRPVTEIALDAGYQTPSAFNRVFRAALGVSPTRFRTASPTQRQKMLVRLEYPRRSRPMTLKLSKTPEIRERAEVSYLHVRRMGVCADEAPGAWNTLNAILAQAPVYGPDSEFIGASCEDSARGADQRMRYDAGVTVAPGTKPPPGLTLGTVAGGKYAVFHYQGSYRHIWEAVDTIFRGWVATTHPTLRAAPLLEIYLNDPRETPEAELLTDLCVPVA